jgi:alpha/beta superfamily hydrolase
MLGLALATAIATGVPFTLQDHRIIVRAYVGNAGPFSMVVDTGSGGMLVTPEVARRLGLNTQPAQALTGAGAGKAPAEKTTIRGLRIGDVRFAPAPALIADLSRIQHGIGFARFDGLIGYDQLKGYRVLVDMDRRRLVFSRAPITVPANAAQTAFAPTDGFVRVAGAVDGVHGTFIVDTGDRSKLTLFRGFANANGLRHFASVRNALTGFGIGGPVYADLLRTTLQAFGTNASGVVTRIPLARTGAFASATDAGSIGNGFLERFNVVYDYPGRRMLTWPVNAAVADTSTFHLPAVPSAPPAPLARHALFGAAVAQKSSGVTITIIPASGPAYVAGLRSNDVVRAVGDRSIGTTADFYQAVHDAAAGSPLAVTYSRDGTVRHAIVTLGTAANESDPTVTTTYGDVVVDGSLRRTILTVPSGTHGPFPAVLIVGGIGCYSVDVATNAQDSYSRLSRDLAHVGFATVRLEKSGVGDSQGPPCAKVDFEAEVRGYRAALSWMHASTDIDPKRIFLLGHSIGSVIAPRIALDGGIAGVIAVEAVGRDWPEYEIRNLRRDLELAGSSAADVDQALIEKSQCMQKYLFENQPAEEVEASLPPCKVHNGVYPVSPWYMRQVVALNIIEPWAKLGIPVLAIYGTSDFETELPDHQRIVDVVNGAHPGSATVVTIDAMSHFLGKAASPVAAMNDYDKRVVEEYDEQLSAAIVAWLRNKAPA